MVNLVSLFHSLPVADISGGVTKYICSSPGDGPPPRCCTGSSCPPPSDQPPGPPGNDHPDDTHSVIINRDGTNEAPPDYWRSVAVFARRNHFDILAEYAVYRLKDAEYLGELAQYPVGVPLSEQQQDRLQTYRQQRFLQTAALQNKWPRIQSQMALMTQQQVNVLANGYYLQMSRMLTTMGLPNHLVSTDFSPAALADGALVIPTAGLYGLSRDTTFAARLENFVQNGGTLVVMSQPDDDGLALLPNSWTQVGYQNDRSCYVAAMTPVAAHPLIASVGTASVTSHVDGYIESIPPSAKMLMQRTKNQQGAFAIDTYGKGHMIVTNMYDDWGRTVGQTSPQVKALFSDVMHWAATPNKELAEGHPGETLSVPVVWENGSSVNATKVRYLLRKPAGALEREWIASQPVATEATVAGAAEVANLPATLGIWSLTYELLETRMRLCRRKAGPIIWLSAIRIAKT